MTKKNFFLRNVAAIVACLAVTVMFSGCNPEDDPVNPDNSVGELTELTSPITQNTTLKDLGLPIDYVYKGSSLLQVKNNAILTIEDSVTIQFTNAGGGIEIIDGATIKALGMVNRHIQFVGGATKGSWDGVVVKTTTDNQFTYVDFINGGSSTQFQNDVAVLALNGARAGISHCIVSGGLGHGIALRDNFTLSVFDNNKVENVDKAPVWMRGSLTKLEKFDMTSDFTNNTNKYVQVLPAQTQTENAVISQTSVPYYFYSNYYSSLKADLTVNAGVTIYMGANTRIESLYKMGVLKINGTVEKPVTFTRLPNSSYYWDCISFNGGAGYSINNCILEYGGGSNSYDYILYLDGCGVSLTNVVIRNSYGYGVKLHRYSGTLNLSHSNVTFANNIKGNVYDIRTSPYQVLTQLP